MILTTIAIVNISYYYNPNIHNLGNIGIGGKIHATLNHFKTYDRSYQL